MAKNFAPKKKYPAGVDEEFVKEVETLSVDDLKTRIVNYEKSLDETRKFLKGEPVEDTEKARESARKLLELKEAYDEAAGPAKETIRHINNRKKVVLDQLKKSGG